MGMDLEVAARKWRSACALLLDLEECDTPKLVRLEFALEGARYVERLQQLQLRYLRCPRHKTLTIWVTCMLVQARALEAASIAVPDVTAIPPLWRLRHLLLTISTKLTLQAFEDMSEPGTLPKLRTLALRFRPPEAPQGPGVNQYYWVGADDIPQSLDMGQHAHLSHVLLSRIAPAAVRLPPACALALNGSLEMCARVWRNSLAQSPLEDHLRALHVTTSKLCHQSPGDGGGNPPPVDVLFSLSDKLQHIFTAGCSRLTRLYLTCASFGTAEGPIRLNFNSFPCLTTLRLVVAQGAGIFLSVSTAVPLEAVKLDARTGVLFLELDDEAAFAESLVVLETRHSTARGDSLRQLAGELARRPGCQLADLGDTLVWCAHQNVKATLAGYFSQASVHDEAAMELACDCGACQVCLVRAGALLPF